MRAVTKLSSCAGGFLSAVLLATLPASALPVPLPDPVVQIEYGGGSVGANDYYNHYVTTYSFTDGGGDAHAVSGAGILLFPSPELSATASIADADNWVAGSASIISYNVKVNGPSNIAVPLLVVGKLIAGIDNDGTGVGKLVSTESAADFYISGGYDPATQFHACGNATADCPNEVAIDFTWDAVANQLATVNLDATANAQTNGSTSASAYSLVDPTFEIDPTFLALNPGYTLSFSPGVGNTSVASVPEPLTLSVFASGVLGAAAMRRRKQKKT